MILHVPPDSPALVKGAAALILATHIGGGSLAVVSGAAALMAPKGAFLHRLAGQVFVVAMLVMASIGAVVSPFLPTPQIGNVIGGVFAMYLVATGWLVVQRKPGEVGRLELVLMAVPAVTVLTEVPMGFAALASPDHELVGVPFEAMFIIAALAAILAACDLRVLWRKGLSGGQRLARHLWRMNTGLLIAFGSALTQPRVYHLIPKDLRTLPIMLAAPIAILAYMLYWLVRLGWAHRRPSAAPASVAQAPA